jgi:integrase
MRGHVRQHGKGWAVIIDRGRNVQCQQCVACRRRHWLEGKPHKECPRCGGELVMAEGRRQQWHRGYRTKREAEQACRELLGGLERGTYTPPTRLTLGEFLVKDWLPAKRATVKPSTFSSYELHVHAYVLPATVAAVPLPLLDGSRLNAFYGELLTDGRRHGNGGLADKTVRNIHGMIHKALGDAVRWRRVAHNVADDADPPRGHSPEMQVWSAEQLRRFLVQVRSDRLYAAWLLSATTGVRRGELLGLRWSDLDLDRGQVNIRQARTVVDYQVQTSTPKTKKGRRIIAIDPVTVASLRSHRTQQGRERLAIGPAWHDSELVFTREDGSPIHPQRFSSWFHQHVKRAGLPRIRLHDVRHSYATAALEAGVRVKVVSERLGHANVTVTLGTYAHVLEGDDQEAAMTVATAILGE